MFRYCTRIFLCIALQIFIEPVEETPDISDVVLQQFKADNILLLNMSTLRADRNITESSYCYNGITVKGYGQLEAVPKLLIEEGKAPDIIIILASAATKKKMNFSLQGEDGIFVKQGSAVDFFKEQTAKAGGHAVTFKVVDLDKRIASDEEPDKKDVVSAVGEAVEIIRTLKHNNTDVHLYLDIHGGPREDQVAIEAIINLLAMEDIHITEAFSISGVGQNVPIMNVTELFRIFDFVSAMNEFMNFGQSRSMKAYVNQLSREANQNEFYMEISNGIEKISDALLLCRVNEFERALDSMQQTIGKLNYDNTVNDYLDIFISNIKSDYGILLQKEKRNLPEEVLWAFKKGFYQQCLAIIESKTPKYVFTNFFECTEDGDVKCVIWTTLNGSRVEQISTMEFLKRVLNMPVNKNVNNLLKLRYEYLSKALLYSDKTQCIIKNGKYEVKDYASDKNKDQKYDIIFD